MTENSSSHRQTLWARGWPAVICLAAIGIIIVGMVLGEAVPILRENRISTLAEFGGLACLIVFAIPLLIAWAVWSLLRVRHWAARTAIYLVFWFADICFAGWVFFSFMLPQP